MLIRDYFQEIESQIAACPGIVESQVGKDVRSLHIGIIEGVVTFSDGSVLHFIEFVDVKEHVEVYRYSYHYQDQDGTMNFRYDMAPHHKKLETFPHHKHLASGRAINASAPTLSNIFDEIDDLISIAY